MFFADVDERLPVRFADGFVFCEGVRDHVLGDLGHGQASVH